jgi:DNA end-binding protein Ku
VREDRVREPQRRTSADLAGLGEKELYARATDLGIPGRSTMKRDELLEALTAADRTAA